MSHSTLNDKSKCYMSQRWLLSPHFLAEDSSDAHLWCHWLHWSLRGWWWCQEFLCQCQQVTKLVYLPHQEARLYWWLKRGSDKYWSNSDCTRHEVLCVKTIPAGDWILHASQSPGKLPQSSGRRSEMRRKIIIIHYSMDVNLSEVVDIFACKNPSNLKCVIFWTLIRPKSI